MHVLASTFSTVITYTPYIYTHTHTQSQLKTHYVCVTPTAPYLAVNTRELLKSFTMESGEQFATPTGTITLPL